MLIHIPLSVRSKKLETKENRYLVIVVALCYGLFFTNLGRMV